MLAQPNQWKLCAAPALSDMNIQTMCAKDEEIARLPYELGLSN